MHEGYGNDQDIIPERRLSGSEHSGEPYRSHAEGAMGPLARFRYALAILRQTQDGAQSALARLQDIVPQAVLNLHNITARSEAAIVSTLRAVIFIVRGCRVIFSIDNTLILTYIKNNVR